MAFSFWPDFKGRDGCRTPMVWSEHEQCAGFTSGEPWLPVPPEHRQLAVDAQDHVQASMLNHYRRLVAFRKAHPALVKGSLEFVDTGEAVLSMIRRDGNEAIFCAFNLSEEVQVIERPEGALEPLDGHGFSGFLRPDTSTWRSGRASSSSSSAPRAAASPRFCG
jgi:alpha-glucosidase